jgi:Carbohydrate binding domain
MYIQGERDGVETSRRLREPPGGRDRRVAGRLRDGRTEPVRSRDSTCNLHGHHRLQLAGVLGHGRFCNGTNAVGAFAEFTVNASAAGTATLGIRFANGGRKALQAKLFVNGSIVQTLSFEGTGAWSTWVPKTLTVGVNVGSNTIRLSPTTAKGLPNKEFDVTCAPNYSINSMALKQDFFYEVSDGRQVTLPFHFW